MEAGQWSLGDEEEGDGGSLNQELFLSFFLTHARASG